MEIELNHKVFSASGKPGVYLMKDDQGTILYVGKARNLKKRLANYFNRIQNLDSKTNALVKKIHDIETIITKTENEALILESSLIKKYKPKYNINLKDDKQYPWLRIDLSHPFPDLTIIRRPKKDKCLYFGPYTSTHKMRQTFKLINKIFKLRKCKTKSFAQRSRPCLHHQMGNCLGPCCLEVSPEKYKRIVDEVIMFLKGRTPDLISSIKNEMLFAAKEEQFELAAELRDRMFSLQHTLEKQVMVVIDHTDRDVIGISQIHEFSAIAVLCIRQGYLVDSKNFEVLPTLALDAEIITAFIHKYYGNSNFVPNEILVSTQIDEKRDLENWLQEKKNQRVKIVKPIRGEKTKLIFLSIQNAKNFIETEVAANASKKDLLLRLKNRLQLDHIPQRIECFDNSTTGGTEPVASMVVFENGVIKKSDYRKYIIKSVPQIDDYAYMAEILHRRFAKGEKSKPYPNLLMVDGGKGQLNIALRILDELDLKDVFDVVGIAKKEELRGETHDKIYKPGRSNPINFNKDADLLLFLQRIRDEAHRFAITFHRNRLKKKSIGSRLDQIPGIGKKRRIFLLKHFGSIKKIQDATVEEIANLPGLNETIAQAIKSSLTNSTTVKNRDGNAKIERFTKPS